MRFFSSTFSRLRNVCICICLSTNDACLSDLFYISSALNYTLSLSLSVSPFSSLSLKLIFSSQETYRYKRTALLSRSAAQKFQH